MEVRTERPVLFAQHTDRFIEETEHQSDLENRGETLIWENQHHSSTMFIGVALNDNARQAKILLTTAGTCLNPGSLLEPKKNHRPELQGNLMQKQYLLGPMTWKVMQGNAWNWRIKQLSNKTKSRRHASMIINLKKKKIDQLENYLPFAHKLF